MDHKLIENNYTVFFWLRRVEIAVFWSKTAFLGIEKPGFEVVLAFFTPIFDEISPKLPLYIVGSCVGLPLVPFGVF